MYIESDFKILFDKFVENCANQIYKVLNDDSNKTLDYKFMQLRNEFDRQGMLMYCREVDGLGRQFDKYTEALFKDYDNNKWKYVNNPEYEFLKENLDNIKQQFKDEKHLIPENYYLDINETLELLAKRNALKQASSNLFKSTYSEEDTVDSIFEKLITEEPIKIERQKEEGYEKNKDFTVRRKALIFHYLLKGYGIDRNVVDATLIARLIASITGNDYKNIYDEVLSPYGKVNERTIAKDTNFIITEFEKLGLTNLIELVKKDQNK